MPLKITESDHKSRGHRSPLASLQPVVSTASAGAAAAAGAAAPAPAAESAAAATAAGGGEAEAARPGPGPGGDEPEAAVAAAAAEPGTGPDSLAPEGGWLASLRSCSTAAAARRRSPHAAARPPAAASPASAHALAARLPACLLPPQAARCTRPRWCRTRTSTTPTPRTRFTSLGCTMGTAAQRLLSTAPLACTTTWPRCARLGARGRPPAARSARRPCHRQRAAAGCCSGQQGPAGRCATHTHSPTPAALLSQVLSKIRQIDSATSVTSNSGGSNASYFHPNMQIIPVTSGFSKDPEHETFEVKGEPSEAEPSTTRRWAEPGRRTVAAARQVSWAARSWLPSRSPLCLPHLPARRRAHHHDSRPGGGGLQAAAAGAAGGRGARQQRRRRAGRAAGRAGRCRGRGAARLQYHELAGGRHCCCGCSQGQGQHMDGGGEAAPLAARCCQRRRQPGIVPARARARRQMVHLPAARAQLSAQCHLPPATCLQALVQAFWKTDIELMVNGEGGLVGGPAPALRRQLPRQPNQAAGPGAAALVACLGRLGGHCWLGKAWLLAAAAWAALDPGQPRRGADPGCCPALRRWAPRPWWRCWATTRSGSPTPATAGPCCAAAATPSPSARTTRPTGTMRWRACRRRAGTCGGTGGRARWGGARCCAGVLLLLAGRGAAERRQRLRWQPLRWQRVLGQPALPSPARRGPSAASDQRSQADLPPPPLPQGDGGAGHLSRHRRPQAEALRHPRPGVGGPCCCGRPARRSRRSSFRPAAAESGRQAGWLAPAWRHPGVASFCAGAAAAKAAEVPPAARQPGWPAGG
jgi:hypothetical protein